MQRGLSALFTLGIILTGPATVAAQHQSSPADYRPMEFLVGSCWIGTFPDGKATDEHCFEWVFNKQFIRDRHIVKGGEPYQGETIYGWDPVAKQLAFWYWNSEGEILVGRVEYASDSIVFPTRHTTPKGVSELKAVLTRVGSDGYRVSQSERTATGWKPLWTTEMKRKGSS